MCCDGLFLGRVSQLVVRIYHDFCFGRVSQLGGDKRKREGCLVDIDIFVRTQEFGKHSVLVMARLQEPSGTE